MEEYLKKILISVLVISVLFIFLFLGINYFGNQLTSVSSIITAWVTINPLEVNVSAPKEVEIDKVFKVKAKLINKGEEKIEKVKGEIFLPEELGTKKDKEQEIGTIAPYKEKTISWPVKGEKVGNYVISVKVSGELKRYGISAEDSIIIEVKESLKRAQPINWFQNLFNFFQKWLL